MFQHYLIGVAHVLYGLVLVGSSIVAGFFLDIAFLFYAIHAFLFVLFGLLIIIALCLQTYRVPRVFVTWCKISTGFSFLTTIAIATTSFTRALGDHHCTSAVIPCSILFLVITFVSFSISLLGVRLVDFLELENERLGLLRPRSFSDDVKIPPPQQLPVDPRHRAVLLFNSSPSAALKYMEENGIIQPDEPSEIAKFLFNEENINLTQLGDFLGNGKNFQILSSFVNLFNFTDLTLDEALRTFLCRFRLPGEAQKIDRMMEQFALRFTRCNPHLFPSSDTAYVLSFSLIMLNTDAHNPAIKKKMTLEDFIHNNKGIADGKDLSDEYLTQLFNSIVSKEIKFLSSGFFSKSVKSGWLRKQGTNNRWQMRWFVVANNCLLYFRNEEDEKPSCLIPLEGTVVAPNEKDKKVFQIYDPGFAKLRSVKLGKGKPREGNHSSLVLLANTVEEAEEWIAIISTNTVANPVLQLINLKRQHMERVGLIEISKYINLDEVQPVKEPTLKLEED